MEKHIINAYAKVNIGLNVYKLKNLNIKHKFKTLEEKHQIQSIFMLTNKFYDTIEVEQSNSFSVMYLENGVVTSFENDPVIKVVEYLHSKYNLNINFSFKVIKGIPRGAGLGGSSADAGVIASFLLDVNRIQLDSSDFLHIALKIGSDIPFFISGFVLALVENYGDYVLGLNLKMPNIKIHSNCIQSDTKSAYALFDKNQDELVKNDYIKIIGNFSNLKDCIINNNLERFVLETNPELKDLKKDNWILTGSGSYFIEILGDDNES
ncbi:MAG: hypothetical protein ACRC4M_03610 [Mycoplasma sp.]